MTIRTSALATIAAVALALAGCEHEAGTGDPKSEEARVGSIRAALTLPDGAEITEVHYEIVGPGTYTDSGDVPVGDSTVLTFRIGGIPIGTGTITLSATTGFGNDCLGSAPFEILNNQVSMVAVILSCGATDDEGDLIVNGSFESCPVVTAITAIPAEVTLGNSIALSAMISHGDSDVVWSGAGGTFSAAGSYATDFTCGTAGSHELTVTIANPALPDCDDAQTVDVTCTLGAGCTNGAMDAGEECDDGNTVNDDGCTNSCQLPECGDSILQAGEGEECDDGNNSNSDACSATCLVISCGNSRVDPGEACDDGNTVDDDTCSNECALPGCGDGIVQMGEECDDGNTVEDDACDNACSANVCGNGDLEPGEDCDDGNLVAGDGCDASCNVEVVDTCGPCRTAACSNYMGSLNVVAGCLDASASGDTARAVVGASFSMAQVQACVDVVDCAFANDCAYNPSNRVSPCYCGTLSVDDCNNAANAVNGACQTEVETAIGSATRSTIMLGMSDLSLPMGWAYFLLECDGSFCDDSALGDCTPN